jgi:NADH-quinone oxidoreductase subunit B
VTDTREPVRFVLTWGRRYTLTIADVGLACCAIEFVAASMSGSDLIRRAAAPVGDGPPTVDLLVVAGTVTDKLAPAVRRLYDAMPDPRYVMSFGACSNSGGPYWDSYSVTNGVDRVVPVDVYVPGCPPRPEALLQGILQLQQRIDGAPAPDRGPTDLLGAR